MTATILIADDLEPNLKLLEAKLLSEYYTVITASNGAEALERLKDHKIDLVMLDVMMPEIDGFGVCERIKSNPETVHIPVIIVTALSEISDRVKGLEAGADEFITKPINDLALFARVKSLTRMKTIVDELKLRNKTSAKLGGNIIELKDNFFDAKILILDDDIIQVKHIKSALKDITERIYILPSIKQIDEYASLSPDLVTISCQLDVDDPLKIVVALKAKPNFKNTSFMLLAEEENMPIVIKGMEIGINDYFIYPVEKSELQARVKTQLRKKQYQDDLRTELEESVDLSTKDGLTGLFNRRYFDIHIKQMIDKSLDTGQKLCLMMFDIDDFKLVNDTYGHQAGDSILRILSKNLKLFFRITDLISRYGGEEFVVLLGNVDLEQGKKLAKGILKKIASINFKIPQNNKTIKQTVSIGVVEYKNSETVENFISRVDKSLYKAKFSGKNQVMSLKE